MTDYIDIVGLGHYDGLIKAYMVSPRIIVQPEDCYATEGAWASFHVGTNDAGARYRWQWFVNGGWAMCPHEGNASPTLYVKCTSIELAASYRCIVEFSDGTTEVTDAVGISATMDCKIIKQPESMFVASTSERFHFEVKVNVGNGQSGSVSGLQFKWQTSTDGSTWTNSSLTGNTTSYLGNINATAARQGYLYRCRILFPDSEDYVYTEPVSVTTNADAASSQAQSLPAAEGELF